MLTNVAVTNWQNLLAIKSAFSFSIQLDQTEQPFKKDLVDVWKVQYQFNY